MAEETTTEEVADTEKDQAAHVDTKKVKKLQRVQLTDTELLQHGADLAAAQQELAETNDELASIKADYKMRTTAIEAKESKLGSLLRQKYEMRNVECEIVLDFDEGTVTVTRLDTDEVVESRQMNDEEKKRELNLWPVDDPAKDPNHEPPISNAEIRDAIGIIVSTKRASCTAIQRRMGLSERRAWMVLDKLEELKVVGGPQEDGAAREVLMDEVNLQRFLEDYPEKAEEKETEAAREVLENDPGD